jgi:uncharacterized membrane protein
MRHVKEISRLEAFSDAVFAFALTLLVVSLEVPSSYRELMNIVRGFIPFACSFAIVTWIWYEHNKFFRRYGMEDPFTVSSTVFCCFSCCSSSTRSSSWRRWCSRALESARR